MIKINLTDEDKFCACCNVPENDVKSIEFSVKNYTFNKISVCLCKDCRKTLLQLLKEEVE